jgi:hypothetical protein
MSSQQDPVSDGSTEGGFPPLMQILDTYMNASSEMRYDQVVEKVKSTRKRHGKKSNKKKSIGASNVPTMDPLPADVLQRSADTRMPESTSERVPRQGRDSNDRDSYGFDPKILSSNNNMTYFDDSLSSITKGKVPMVSSPPLTDKNAHRGEFNPKSPVRSIVSAATAGGYGSSSIHSSSIHRRPVPATATYTGGHSFMPTSPAVEVCILLWFCLVK